MIIVTAQAQQPSYSVGDYWKYRIEFLSASEIVMEGTVTRTIVEESNEQYVMEVVGSWHPPQQDTVMWTETGRVYLQKSDLSIVKDERELKQMSGEEVTYHLITNITYSPPYKESDFPLDVGKFWWGNTTRTQTIELPPLPPGTSITQFSRNFTVVRTEGVTVPAGTFDSLVVASLTFDNVYEKYYSSRANGNVRELVYDRNMNLKERRELLESNRIELIPGLTLELLTYIIIAIVAVVIVVVVVFYLRRRPPPGAPTVTPPPPPKATAKT
ncbi:MAG: hypothetical protein H3Z50_07120 [archaeon]|nr:hypothetical protein [archaeon]